MGGGQAPALRRMDAFLDTEHQMEPRRIRADEGLKNRAIRLRMLADAPDAFGGTLADALARPEASWHLQAAALARSTERALFVVEEGSRWLGIVGGILERDAEDGELTVEVVAVWVEPAARRRGLAQALVERVVAWATELGAGRACLWVHDANLAAIRLYERLRFVQTEDRAPLGAHGDRTRLLMVRDLGSATQRPTDLTEAEAGRCD
jgi:GNAT superfamily N-acetyltransferase